MNNVIFLDVDGVLVSGKDIENNKKTYPNVKDLNVYDHFPDRSFKLLQELVSKSGAKVVLSSTIRLGRMFGKDYMGGAYVKLEEQLAKYGIQIADITALIDGYNETEITDYITRHPEIENYVIINDDDLPSLKEHLLRTNFNDGITEATVDRALGMLLANKKKPQTNLSNWLRDSVRDYNEQTRGRSM